MKRFKFFLGLLFVWIFWFTCFWSCDNLFSFIENKNLSSSNSLTWTCGWYCCFLTNNTNSNYRQNIVFNSDKQLFPSDYNAYDLSCVSYSWNFIVSSSISTNVAVRWYDLSSLVSTWGSTSCPDCPFCDKTSLMFIHQWWDFVSLLNSSTWLYNLYLSNWLDFSTTPIPEWQNVYITWYDLSWVISSELIINDIVHQSAPLINITIPEEFDWDYTWNVNEFTLDIKGFNVDTEYIDWIIRTQKTTPNNTDFNNIVSGLIPLLVPGLFIILFIYFIFRFIKKVF